jgi:hypothetical protein
VYHVWYDANCCDRLLEGVDERDLAGGADHRASPGRPRQSATAGEPRQSRPLAGVRLLPDALRVYLLLPVSRSTIGGVAVMLVSFDACRVTPRMRTAGPRSGPRDQGEAGKPPGRYPHEA